MATEVTVIVDPDNGAGTDYTSLAAAIAGEARDLVTADEQLTIKCRCTGGTADGAVTVDGFTTDATRYVKIWTDPTESYRHAGIFPSGNKYRIESTNAIALTVQDNYVRLVGVALKLTLTTGTSYCIRTNAGGGNFRVEKCFLLGDCTGTGGAVGIYAYINGTTLTVISSTVTGFISSSNPTDTGFAALSAFNSSTAFWLYNCTLCNSYYGLVIGPNGGSYAYNCAVFNNANDFHSSGATLTIDYCASDDGDGTNAVDISPGATEADDWAACFTDYANGDFSLKSDSVCVGAGTDDPGSGLYSDDILGNTRTSTWDIGAFEYVSFKAAWAINSNRVIQ